jgi:hypothetical protein
MISQVRHWLPFSSNRRTISPLQDYAEAGNLILQSNQPNSLTSNAGPYVYDDVIRSVSFTSLNDLSDITITVKGIGSPVTPGNIENSGNPIGLIQSISEQLSGPDGGTVETAYIYKQIDSITIDDAANGLSVGFGTFGITDYVFHDNNVTSWDISYQGAINNQETLQYTIYNSLTNPQTINSQFGNLTNYPFQIPAFLLGDVNSADNQLLTRIHPVAMSWATVKATESEDFYFTVVQQGTRS